MEPSVSTTTCVAAVETTKTSQQNTEEEEDLSKCLLCSARFDLNDSSDSDEIGKLINAHLMEEHPMEVSRHLLADNYNQDDKLRKWIAMYTALGRIIIGMDQEQPSGSKVSSC